MGGEAVSLAINYEDTAAFKAAGYEDVHVNNSYIGGQVRQHGNFSFTRVYQAGHLVPAYQPETAYVLFDRVIRGVSLATGNDIQTSGANIYSSTGPANTTVGLRSPKPPQPTCFVRNIMTCTDNQIQMIGGGLGIIINGVLYNSSDEYVEPNALPAGPDSENINQDKKHGSGGSLGGAGGDDPNAAATRGASLLVLVLAFGLVICAL